MSCHQHGYHWTSLATPPYRPSLPAGPQGYIPYLHRAAKSKKTVSRTSIDKIKENGFKLTKERSRRYPAKTITDADYADDIALLANTPAQAETLLLSLEGAAVGIGLHVNAHKTEYMCFNQTGDISTRNGRRNICAKMNYKIKQASIKQIARISVEQT